MVLLKNNGVLPLPASTKKISVVGPLADQLRVLLGNYNGTPSRATTVFAGIRQQFSGAEVTYERGANFPIVTVAVPETVLRTDDGMPGLKAQLFAGGELSGAAFLTRIDAQVNHRQDSAVLPQGVSNYSIRWTGWLVPNESGKYRLGLNGSANTLSLDGTMLVDARGMHAPESKTVEVELVKGRKYAITIESFPGLGQMVTLVWSQVIPNAIERAVAMAKQAEVVVAVVGINSELEGEESKLDIPGFKGGDRTSLDLPEEEESLLKALKVTGKPLVVVLMNGSAMSVNWAQQNADAIVEAWYPGEEGGAAVAETLAGVNNPAGRLPVTFYQSVQQLPPFDDYSMANRTYRYFQGQPLYPFGYGLSYARFRYVDLRLNSQRLGAGQSLVADVTLTNRSDIDGDEVVQLYLDFPQIPGAPRRALRGFQRVHLKAGESRRLSFRLSPRDLSSVDEAGNRRVATGSYQLSLGGGQPGTGATVRQRRFTVAEATPVPDKAD
jgi:beta-glucosidase